MLQKSMDGINRLPFLRQGIMPGAISTHQTPQCHQQILLNYNQQKGRSNGTTFWVVSNMDFTQVDPQLISHKINNVEENRFRPKTLHLIYTMGLPSVASGAATQSTQLWSIWIGSLNYQIIRNKSVEVAFNSHSTIVLKLNAGFPQGSLFDLTLFLM